ncbi:hypothetical protein VTI74DRAFT_7150 [Chaetomium olivicolor]
MDYHKPTTPFSRDKLIQGNDIELASAKPAYQEHSPNPGLEVLQHSTLELAKPPPTTYYPQQQKHHLLPHPGAVFDPSEAGWGDGPHSNPNSIYAQSTSPSVAATAPGARYSYSDFCSPFDQRTLVETPKEGRGKGKERKGERICGVARQLFWVVLAVGVFVVVVAVATGVGVGVGMSGKGSSTPSPTSSSTRTFPAPVATSTPSAASISCPSNNLTLYPSTINPQKTYLLLCGRDYNSNLGTTQDMYHAPTDTLSECIDLCAGQDGCVGAGWGRGSTGGGRAICWLKSRLGVMNEAPAWSFVVEDSGI